MEFKVGGRYSTRGDSGRSNVAFVEIIEIDSVNNMLIGEIHFLNAKDEPTRSVWHQNGRFILNRTGPMDLEAEFLETAKPEPTLEDPVAELREMVLKLEKRLWDLEDKLEEADAYIEYLARKIL